MFNLHAYIIKIFSLHTTDQLSSLYTLCVTPMDYFTRLSTTKFCNWVFVVTNSIVHRKVENEAIHFRFGLFFANNRTKSWKNVLEIKLLLSLCVVPLYLVGSRTEERQTFSKLVATKVWSLFGWCCQVCSSHSSVLATGFFLLHLLPLNSNPAQGIL